MNTEHAEERLIPYLRAELAPAERRAVQAHLAGCGACREVLADFGRVLTELRARVPEPPAVHWGAYRAELRDKLERRTARPSPGFRWRAYPLRAALAAGLVAVLIYAGVPWLGGRGSGNGDPGPIDNVILASRLDLIARLDLVQRLDLLEDFDVIGRLDRLPLRGEG